jgi:hypothetical protein
VHAIGHRRQPRPALGRDHVELAVAVEHLELGLDVPLVEHGQVFVLFRQIDGDALAALVRVEIRLKERIAKLAGTRQLATGDHIDVEHDRHGLGPSSRRAGLRALLGERELHAEMCTAAPRSNHG